MNGHLFQLLDSDNDEVGLIHYNGEKFNEIDLALQWQKFSKSPDNDSDSVDDFVDYLNDKFEHPYFERVYVKEVFIA